MEQLISKKNSSFYCVNKPHPVFRCRSNACHLERNVVPFPSQESSKVIFIINIKKHKIILKETKRK